MRSRGLTSSALHEIYPYIALGFGILALSFSGLFVRWSQAPGPVTSFYRMLIAVVVLLPIILARVHRYGLPPLRWLLLPTLGGLFTALDHGMWSASISYTRVATATLLNNIAPVWVALFAVLVWKERLPRTFWMGLALTLIGAAVVLGADVILSPQMSRGNLLALVSSLFYAAYFLATQRGRSHLDPLTYVWIVDLFSALGLFGITRLINAPLNGFNQQTWLIFLCAALVSQVGGYFAIAYALGRLPASVVSPSMVSQPVITALLAVPLAGEVFTPLQILGGLAVVAGIYWINHSRMRLVKN